MSGRPLTTGQAFFVFLLLFLFYYTIFRWLIGAPAYAAFGFAFVLSRISEIESKLRRAA